MYESGLSVRAKILFLILAVLLGWLFIVSGCANKANAASDSAQLVQIQTASGELHSFF